MPLHIKKAGWTSGDAFLVKRVGLTILIGFCAAVGGTPALADTASLFGSSEIALGDAGSRLSAGRFQKLLVSSGLEDTRVAHKWTVVTRLIRWQTPLNKLKLVQQYFNTLPYHSDQTLYGKADYWASVGEFLANGGDCEDFAITKYRALVEGGFDPESLRIVLLHDRVNDTAHAVLAAYLDGQVWILDNQIEQIVPQSTIGHYRPIYSMNSLEVWRHDRAPEQTTPLDDIKVATRAE